MGSSWHFAGIDDEEEIDEWRSVGVFDPQRAGLLRAAGVRPEEIAGLPDVDGRSVGVAYALGELSLSAVCAAIDASTASGRLRTGVRRRCVPAGDD